MRRYVARNGLKTLTLQQTIYFYSFLYFHVIVTLGFQSNYAYVERRDELSMNAIDIDNEPRYFNVSMTIRVPSQPIL
jgi:hypothetical protein